MGFFTDADKKEEEHASKFIYLSLYFYLIFYQIKIKAFSTQILSIQLLIMLFQRNIFLFPAKALQFKRPVEMIPMIPNT